MPTLEKLKEYGNTLLDLTESVWSGMTSKERKQLRQYREWLNGCTEVEGPMGSLNASTVCGIIISNFQKFFPNFGPEAKNSNLSIRVERGIFGGFSRLADDDILDQRMQALKAQFYRSAQPAGRADVEGAALELRAELKAVLSDPRWASLTRGTKKNPAGFIDISKKMDKTADENLFGLLQATAKQHGQPKVKKFFVPLYDRHPKLTRLYRELENTPDLPSALQLLKTRLAELDQDQAKMEEMPKQGV